MFGKGLEVPEKELSPPSEVSTRPSSVHGKTEFESRLTSQAHSDEENSEETEIQSSPPEDYPKGFRLVAIVISLITSVFLVSLDNTIVATAIPRITDQFHSLDDVGWYSSAFFLTFASFQSLWGKALKYFPLKVTFLMTIVVFEVGSLICGVAQNSTTLIIGRAIAGAGGAGIASGAYTLIALSAPPSQRPAFTGLLGATYGTASVIGPLLGGVFTDKTTWRWCFYVNLPIGGAAFAIILFSFTAPRSVQPVKADLREKFLQMDIPGTALLIAAIVCLILALGSGGVTKPWSNSSIIGELVGFVVLLICFGLVEFFSGDRALIQGRLLKKRIIYVGILYIFVFAGNFFMLLYYIPIYFQAVDGVSPAESGIRNVPFVVGVSLLTVISGMIISRWGHYVPIMIIGSILSTIGTGLLYTLDVGSPSSHWIGYQALAGIGAGLGVQVPIIIAQASVDPIDISAASAMVLFFQTLGASVFSSVGQSVFANKLLSSLPRTTPSVSPAQVFATGAAGIRTSFTTSEVPGIIASYLEGLHDVFILGIALAGTSVLVAVFAPWQRINAKVATVAP